MTTEVAADTPATEYHSARSRTASMESNVAASLAPLSDARGRQAIGVSNNAKRQFKDMRIYVNARTGLPVRPPTSFGLYKHALRRTMKDSKVEFAEFNKKANERWNKMKDEEKEPYVQRAKELAEQFKKIEVSCLRRKVRQLQGQVKQYRRAASQISRRL